MRPTNRRTAPASFDNAIEVFARHLDRPGGVAWDATARLHLVWRTRNESSDGGSGTRRVNWARVEMVGPDALALPYPRESGYGLFAQLEPGENFKVARETRVDRVYDSPRDLERGGPPLALDGAKTIRTVFVRVSALVDAFRVVLISRWRFPLARGATTLFDELA